MTRMSLVALVAGCATSRFGTIPLVPENLRTPATEVLSLETEATGVQIYECNASKDVPTRFEWVFKAPEADLFDEAGNKIGKHYAGPTSDVNFFGVFMLIQTLLPLIRQAPSGRIATEAMRKYGH
jgi:hypothetical protein